MDGAVDFYDERCIHITCSRNLLWNLCNWSLDSWAAHKVFGCIASLFVTVMGSEILDLLLQFKSSKTISSSPLLIVWPASLFSKCFGSELLIIIQMSIICYIIKRQKRNLYTFQITIMVVLIYYQFLITLEMIYWFLTYKC